MRCSTTIIFLIIAHIAAFVQYTCGEKSRCYRPISVPCVQNLCFCAGKGACCEDHGKELRYIPKLPKYVNVFTSMRNYLPQISKQTFTNMSHLRVTKLAFIDDSVLRVTEDAFADLPYLQRLEISSNPKINKTELSMSFKSLTNEIKTLILKNIGLTTMIPENFFEGLQGSNIRSLHLDNNRLTYVNMSVFQYLPNLELLKITNNAIQEFTVYTGHPSLETLRLTSNEISRKPPSFCPPKGSVFPKLIKLSLDRNLISEIVPQAWKCLSKLTDLRIGGNKILHIPNNAIADLNDLREFWVDGMFVTETVFVRLEKLSFNSTSLRKLVLNSNKIVFSKEHLQNQIFAACKQIAYLNIDNNNLLDLREDGVSELLSPLAQLERLYMSNTNLLSIPKALLKHFPKLEHFEADNNGITELGESLIGAPNLKSLNIQKNYLRVLKPESFPLSLRKTLRSLNLGGNSFDCSCENLWFRNWISDDGTAKGTNISLKSWPNGYRCATPKSLHYKLLKSFRPTEASCRLLFNLYISLGSIGGILTVLIISIPICIRYRWYIRYKWYKITRTRKNGERSASDDEGNGLQTQPYTYVIYHDSDRDFVHNAFLNLVEEDLGFKLYIWHRNAAHGSKANVMFDAIHESYHVLAIISKTFVTDGWCEFQLDIGLEKKNESRSDCLTLLVLENLDWSLLRKTWCVTLAKNATVHWCSDPKSIQRKVCLDKLNSRLEYKEFNKTNMFLSCQK